MIDLSNIDTISCDLENGFICRKICDLQDRQRPGGGPYPQRRLVALVVIVQIQWLCQGDGGGGPAATQTAEFLDPLDKNSWCCLGCFVQFGKICVICCDRVCPQKQACLMIGLLSNSWENTSSCYLALVVLTSLMFQLYWYLWCIRTYMHMKWKPSRVYWSWNAVNCIKLLHISMRTRHGALI